MSKENPVMRKGWVRAARHAVLWRLNSGKAWLSGLGPKGVKVASDRTYARIEAPRPIAIGLALFNGDSVVGPSDLIGRTTIEITPEMVGQRVAVFTSLEAKRTSGGRTSADQVQWRDETAEAGGIAGIFTTESEAENIILDWCKKTGARLP